MPMSFQDRVGRKKIPSPPENNRSWVIPHNLFLLFKHEFLGRKEKGQRLKTIRYTCFVLSAQMVSVGREPVLRISARGRKVRAKLSSLFTRISHYVPRIDLNCTVVGHA